MNQKLLNTNDRALTTYIVFFILFILISIFTSYYRYMVRGDFVYFYSESEIPDRFSLDTY